MITETIIDALLEDDFDDFDFNDLVERKIAVDYVKAIMAEVGIIDIVRLPELLRDNFRNKMFVCFEGNTMPHLDRKAIDKFFALVTRRFDEVGVNIGLTYNPIGVVWLAIALDDFAEY
jgi:hypothetical protein